MIFGRARIAATVFTLAILLLHGAATRAQEVPAEPTSIDLLAVTIPADLLPPVPAKVVWEREQFEPESRFAVPVGDRGTGVAVSFAVVEGVDVEVEAPLLLGRAAPGTGVYALETVATGEPVRLARGDVVVYANEAELQISNTSQEIVSLVTARIVSTAQSATGARAADEAQVSIAYLGEISSEVWAVVPPGPLEIRLQRTLLTPGSTMPLPVPGQATQRLLAIEAGLLEAGRDGDGDGAPDQWATIQPFLPVSDILRGGPGWTIRASDNAPLPIPDDLVLGPPPPGPLVVMTLSLIPTNADATLSDVLLGAEPAVVMDGACEDAPIVLWARATDVRIAAFTDKHSKVFNSDPDRVISANPPAARRAAKAMRALAEEQAAGIPPAGAAQANADLVEMLNQIAGSIDVLADSLESGDDYLAMLGAVDVSLWAEDLPRSIDPFGAYAEACQDLEAVG